MLPASRILRSILAMMGLSVVFALIIAPAVRAGPVLEYRNEKWGFFLQVPSEVFIEGVSRNPEAGNIWISRDQRARLSAVAGPNDSGQSLEDYRRLVMEETYAGARFDYTPVRDTWFVLSGVKDKQVFYERITFVCDGRYIYGWQLFYPVGQKRIYDRIVEEIHRSYRLGNGEGDSCE